MEKEKGEKNSNSFQIQQFIELENRFSKFGYLYTLLEKLIILEIYVYWAAYRFPDSTNDHKIEGVTTRKSEFFQPDHLVLNLYARTPSSNHPYRS